MSNNLRCKVFQRETPRENRQLLAGKRTFSWDRKEYDNSIKGNSGDTCNSKKKQKKKNSHNIIMFSLMQNNNYLLSPSFHLLFFFKLLVVSRFLQNERPRTNNAKINQNIIANLTDRCCEEKCSTNLFFIHSSARCVSRPLITISGLPQNCMISPTDFFSPPMLSCFLPI